MIHWYLVVVLQLPASDDHNFLGVVESACWLQESPVEAYQLNEGSIGPSLLLHLPQRMCFWMNLCSLQVLYVRTLSYKRTVSSHAKEPDGLTLHAIHESTQRFVVVMTRVLPCHL